ncbi:MAG TPA: hypothetical protein PKC30_04320 [Saprospiraceae bacterium]|nr:hypothetical protein [Saprospiraceae bacterium]
MMRKTVIFITLIWIVLSAKAQSDHLLGICSKDDFLSSSHSSWFLSGYEKYISDPSTIESLQALDLERFTIEIYFGTWCGDTQRELPRFLNIINRIGFPEEKVKLIGVGTGSQHKQSPKGETIGKGIYRVATFIVYFDGVERNRITEYPVVSLEKDLFHIFINQDYESNFPSFKWINFWLNEGDLSHPNTSVKGLAHFLKSRISGPPELSSCAKVLFTQGLKDDAVNVFRVNNYIYDDQASTFLDLAQAYIKVEKPEEAIETIYRLLKLQNDEVTLKKALHFHYQAMSAMHDDAPK